MGGHAPIPSCKFVAASRPLIPALRFIAPCGIRPRVAAVPPRMTEASVKVMRTHSTPPFAGVRCGTAPPPTSCTGIALRSQLASMLEVMDIHHNDRLEAARGAHAQFMDQMQSQKVRHAEMMDRVVRLETRLHNDAPPGLAIAAVNLEPSTMSCSAPQLVWDSIRKHLDTDDEADQSTLVLEEESQTNLRATNAEHKQGPAQRQLSTARRGLWEQTATARHRRLPAQEKCLSRATKGLRKVERSS